ncbi:MAG: UvrB/UvrC motif-containing protein, partial [Alphaproteobacteria bacterium]|nr:UvrB/UvrC motif-containing protein [Alphaproteobacteria bacterium]
KSVFEEVKEKEEKTDKTRKFVYNKDGVWDADSLRKEIKSLTQKMKKAAEDLEFETAAELRDAIHKLEDDLLLVE